MDVASNVMRGLIFFALVLKHQIVSCVLRPSRRVGKSDIGLDRVGLLFDFWRINLRAQLNDLRLLHLALF